MGDDRLRISGFSNRAWMEHAAGELRELGFGVELDLSGAEGRRYALIVRGRPAALEPLRPLADAPGGAAECGRSGFAWSDYVNGIDGLACG